jgi:Mn2+/Fe2+ NRAMP family transporter
MSQQRQNAKPSHRAEAQNIVEIAVAEPDEVTCGALGIRQQRQADWRPLLKRLLVFLAVLGPGQIVMMADTEVGSVITAAQSGARWGYALLPLQFILIPILFIVQELTVRLGIFTGKGHGELIRERYGVAWGWISIGGLALSIMGAMVAEFSGIAGVGELLGGPRAVSLSLAVGFLLLVVWAGSYRRVERIALGLGLFEMAFLWVALKSHPHAGWLLQGLTLSPWRKADYRYLVAANIGAVIMPWMIFFQQSAIVDKRLGRQHLRAAQCDTAIGSVVTQLVMAAVIVTTAATLGFDHGTGSLETVGEISQALTPYLGAEAGRLVFGLGILGAALVAIIVTSLAAAWAIGEMTGYKHSLDNHPREAPWFYVVYSTAVVGSAILVARVPNLIALNLAVEVMNALLLPLVLGFLVLLAARVLPERHSLRGFYLWVVAATCAITSGVGVYCALSGMRW